MISVKKIDFSKIDWETSAFGIRSKSFLINRRKMRLLELAKDLDHPNWCKVGHIGYVLKGELEIIFVDEIIRYSEGDAIIIESGEQEKHIPKPISEKVSLLLIEDI